MPATAFRVSYGQGKPVIGIMAEYDTLPDLGHACSHNVIATCALGTALASKLAIDQFGGSILASGRPAEEIWCGKSLMADRGTFNNLDIAMMAHPVKGGLNR